MSPTGTQIVYVANRRLVPSIAVRSRREADYRRRQRGTRVGKSGVFARRPIDRALREPERSRELRSPAEPP